MSDAINPEHYKRLPAEAIEIIESAIDKAPSNQDAYLHGQVLKYVLRCWNKNGIEDIKKAKWYLDRLIDSFDESEAEQLATVEVAGEVTGEVTGVVKPPDGWRWLEVGEILRRLDATFNSNGSLYELNQEKAGRTVTAPNVFIRRNRFDVGEKVIDCRAGVIFMVQHFNEKHQIVFVDGVSDGIESKHFAPYIEETK